VLPKEVAEVVGRHLIAAGRLLDSDPESALKHAKAARTKAPRFGIVREAVGEAAYHCGDWHTALMELRAALRVSGNQALLPMIIDCERALGRIEKAWQLLDEAAQRHLDVSIRAELAVLAAGMHREAGNLTDALKQVALPELRSPDTAPWLARLRYCYADILAERNQLDQAATWFTLAAAVDADDDTDAADRLLELQGIALYSEGTEAIGDELDVLAVPDVASGLPADEPGMHRQ